MTMMKTMTTMTTMMMVPMMLMEMHIFSRSARCKAAEELKWVGARQNLVTIAIVMRIDDGPVLVMMMERTIMLMMERTIMMMMIMMMLMMAIIFEDND